MPRRNAASKALVAPPQLPAQLAVVQAQESLAKHASFSRCALQDARFDAQSADDILFEEMLGRRIGLNQVQVSLAQPLGITAEEEE